MPPSVGDPRRIAAQQSDAGPSLRQALRSLRAGQWRARQAASDLNVERLIWAADFPHQESDWPDSDAVFAHNFGGVPPDEVYKMTVGNALRFFRVDGS